MELTIEPHSAPTGLDRRRFLAVGGASAAGILLAACGQPVEEGTDGAAATTTTEPTRNDIAIVRTASSLEYLAVSLYETALSRGIVSTTGNVEVATLLQAHHQEHATTFAAEARKLNAEAFTQPNPVVREQLQTRLSGVADEPGALAAALDFERSLAATYQQAVTSADSASLRTLLMSTGAATARYGAVLALTLNQVPYPASGLHSTDGAVAIGTGV